ncbi:MAG: hypothetical protein JKY50_22390 [Oleispira sp.]|nr:hypothetical protein [Oleispira sp.]
MTAKNLKPAPAAENLDVSKPKVINLTKQAVDGDTSPRSRPQAVRRKLLALSFALLVGLPVIMGSLYYAFVASDRYVSSAGFAVRGVNAGGGMDMIGSLTGLASSGSTTSDSYIILKYLKSRDLVELLQEDAAIREAYSDESIDFISRMGANVPIEEFVEYWLGMIDTSFDATSGVITFDVEAFNPGDAQQVAERVLGYTQNLVNNLSENARQDSVRFAEAEVKMSETRLRDALQQIRLFREQQKSINPAARAQLEIELVSALESRLIDIRARMAAISGSLDVNAPSMMALRRQAEAVEAQIAKKMAGISGTAAERKAGNALSVLLATYESLEVEKNFAEKAYASTLTSLEQARVDADRQQRYLAVYSSPLLAEKAIYPRRGLNILLLIIVMTSIWGICTLIVYSVRDHLS